MSKKKSNKVAEKSASAYTHEQEATQRPDVGVQPEFEARKPPVNYRYDSSLAPEMSWDENAERDMAEWLLNLVGEAADTKAKAAQRWVTAVNQDGNYGLWAYEVVKDPTDLPLLIDKYSAAKWYENATLRVSTS
jgi:hypothetical protein